MLRPLDFTKFAAIDYVRIKGGIELAPLNDSEDGTASRPSKFALGPIRGLNQGGFNAPERAGNHLS